MIPKECKRRWENEPAEGMTLSVKTDNPLIAEAFHRTGAMGGGEMSLRTISDKPTCMRAATCLRTACKKQAHRQGNRMQRYRTMEVCLAVLKKTGHAL